MKFSVRKTNIVVSCLLKISNSLPPGHAVGLYVLVLLCLGGVDRRNATSRAFNYPCENFRAYFFP